MSLYLIVFVLLLAFSVYEYWKRQTQKWLYWIAFGILTVMLCLRYGQGTDYFGYLYNYLVTPPIWQAGKLFNGTIHGEPGWLVVCALFRSVKAPFPLLVFLISAFEMYCLHRFISKYSPMGTVTLLLAFPTIYMTYVVSALRQGLVMMVFLGFLVDWMYRGKWKAYLITTVVCALFHSSALVFFALFAIRLFTLDTKKMFILMIACTVAGFAASWILPKISSVFETYANYGLSIVAIGERMVSTIVILCIFRNVLDQKLRLKNRTLLFLLQIYLYGSLIYCFLMWNSMMSSRFAVYFKAVEIALFAIALRSRVILCKAAAGYLLALTVVMYFKNIGSYIEQGAYFEGTNVWNYPYFSILATGQLEKWREIPYDFSQWFPEKTMNAFAVYAGRWLSQFRIR